MIQVKTCPVVFCDGCAEHTARTKATFGSKGHVRHAYLCKGCVEELVRLLAAGKVEEPK